MPTIQDSLREEARDYQDLAAMGHKALYRKWELGFNSNAWAIARQNIMAQQYRIARSALFELIGAEPERG